MGLFKKIGKAIGGAAKNLANNVGKVVKNPIVSAGLGLAAGLVLPGVGGVVSKGIGSVISKVGGKIKGGKMDSAIDSVLGKVEDEANTAAKGFLGIGDGKPGIFGIGTGKGKAKKAAKRYQQAGGQTLDDDYPTDGDGSGDTSEGGGSGGVLVGAGDGIKAGGKDKGSGGGFLGILALGAVAWALGKPGR